jgi:hypothetical protein
LQPVETLKGGAIRILLESSPLLLDAGEIAGDGKLEAGMVGAVCVDPRLRVHRRFAVRCPRVDENLSCLGHGRTASNVRVPTLNFVKIRQHKPGILTVS